MGQKKHKAKVRTDGVASDQTKDGSASGESNGKGPRGGNSTSKGSDSPNHAAADDPDTTPSDDQQSSPSLSKLKELFSSFRVQLGCRIGYAFLSTIGMICMIRESPTPIFRGWTAFFLVLLLLVNILLSLVASNREIRLVWLFLRSFSSWRFIWALYQLYPSHCIRAVTTASVAGIYVYYYGQVDRQVLTAAAASFALLACDTPPLRKRVWEGESSRTYQVIGGLAGLALLFGWRIYRWFALAGFYAFNYSLLMSDFVPSAGPAELHQFWLAAVAGPSSILYHIIHERGLPTWWSPSYLLFMGIILRARCANDGIKTIRTTLLAGVAMMMEVWAFGLNAKSVIMGGGGLVYLLIVT